ncbi:MAG: amino acid permease [Pseudomonadota bacterium]
MQVPAPEAHLARQITLPLLILYGLSVTVGAGVYVLIGETAARAGQHAPLAFVIAGVLVAFSAASYAELATRFPVSAGEAAYVGAATQAPWAPLVIGLLVCASGLFSSATLLRGGAGYVQEFIAAPTAVIALVTGLLIGAVAAWGIKQSVWTAALLAVAEVGLLLVIAVFGVATAPVGPTAVGAFAPTDSSMVFGLSGAVLIAFFAFIGFEDMVNVAEEVRDPRRTIPWAIGLTLVFTTLLYVSVLIVALSVASPEVLSGSPAPLTLVFQRILGGDGRIVSAIAIAAVVNGVLVQIVMVSRVLYGMSRLGSLPSWLGFIWPATQTPLVATAVTVGCVLVLVLVPQIAVLADLTSTFTLLVFASVNFALWRIKINEPIVDHAYFRVPHWVPVTGFLVSSFFLVFEWFNRFNGHLVGP